MGAYRLRSTRDRLRISLHPLIVHATVVIVPVAALAVLLSFWPRLRRWAPWGPLAAAWSGVG